MTCCDNYSLPCAQASHYQKQMELFVLPECLYGKYTPCEEVNPAPSAQAAAVIMWTANLCMPHDCLSQSVGYSIDDEEHIEPRG